MKLQPKTKPRLCASLRSVSVKRRLSLVFWIIVLLLLLTGASFLRALYAGYENYVALDGSHMAAKFMELVDRNLSSLISLTKYPVVQTDQRPNNTYLYLSNPDQYKRTVLDSDLSYRSTFLFSQNQNIRFIAVFDLQGKGSYVRNDKVANYKAVQRAMPKLENLSNQNPWFSETLRNRGSALIWTYQELELHNLQLEKPDHLLFVTRAIISLDNFRPLGVILAAVDIGESTQFFEENRKYSQQQVGVFESNGRLINGGLTLNSISSFLQIQHSNPTIASSKPYLRTEQGNMLFQSAHGDNGLITLVLTPVKPIWFSVLKQERWLIISLPFVAVILALAMKAVVRSIVVPVNRLADTCMRIVKQEDFTIEIEDYHKDEFSSLAQALNSLTERIRYLIYDVYEKKMELGKTQIQLLRSQMNPHLLYNTLETIRSKALLADQPELAEMSLLLADILRYGISAPGELVPVGEEVSKLQDYLRLQKHLYSDRFNEIIRMDPAVLRLKTIKFILQPLVENAIQHGFSHLKSPGYMEVLGYIDGEDLVFHVIDHGRGMSNEDLQKVIDYLDSSNSNDAQVGLRNVHKRLQLMFGESYGVTINSQINVGTSVYARLPCIVDEKGSE